MWQDYLNLHADHTNSDLRMNDLQSILLMIGAHLVFSIVIFIVIDKIRKVKGRE